MANNRMYLVNERTGEEIFLAKYYPDTGWYIPSHNTIEKINESLGKEQRTNFFGDCSWVIKYEIVDGESNDSAGRAKAEILGLLQKAINRHRT